MIAKARKAYRKTENTCKSCGSFFVAGAQAKYCSRACQLRWYKRPQNRKKRCERCRVEFATARKSQKYCSLKCRAESRKKPIPIVKCRMCGESFRRKQRHGPTDTNGFCSISCSVKWRHTRLPVSINVLNRPCMDCLEPIAKETKRSLRCDDCQINAEQRAYELQLERSRQEYVPKEKYVAKCAECGGQFLASSRAKYCNLKCQKKSSKRKWRHTRRTVSRSGDNITLNELIDRDHGVCCLCFIPIDQQADLTKDGAAPTIDHIVPVSKGGTHTWSNVQLACRRCNSLKSDSLIQVGSIPPANPPERRHLERVLSAHIFPQVLNRGLSEVR